MDERALTRRPSGVELGPVSEQVFDVLSRYTVFPWPVMLAQAKRLEVDAAALTWRDLTLLAPRLVDGVERFTSPEKAAAVREDLQRLLQRVG